jgi:hypothetical protein
MTTRHPGMKRRRQKSHSSKHIRMILFSLGSVGMMIGVALLAANVLSGNPKLRILGILYLLGSVAAFGATGAIAKMDHLRRHEHTGD